ncbi:MAG TPA: hypothetical protein VGG25_07965 [Streptosporangiaceae bacterium]
MRPALKAGLLPVWRDRETVQIGIDPRRAMALTGLGPAVLVLGLLDGSRDRVQVIEAASEQGVPAAVTERILTLLAVGGALDDVTLPGPGQAADRRRLAGELAAVALARGHSDAGAATLGRRQGALVRVYGAGRVATAIAAILRTSGVGQVTIADLVRSPAMPANDGPAPSDPAIPATFGTRGAPTASTASDTPTAPNVPGAPTAPGTQAGHVTHAAFGGTTGARPALPDVAVLVGYPDPELGDWLMHGGVPHLAVTAEEAIGVVGPLVRPGQTACLRCVNLTRAALDPAWPLILAQLAGRHAEPPACDAALAAAVAAQAAVQVLGVIDREPGPGATENGTLELVMPGWQWRRRTWPTHLACGCSSDSPW